MFENTLRENKLNKYKSKGDVESMSDHSVEIQEENKNHQQKESKRPKRYSLYDQININEKYLDYFIVSTIFLLFVVVVYSLI